MTVLETIRPCACVRPDRAVLQPWAVVHRLSVHAVLVLRLRAHDHLDFSCGHGNACSRACGALVVLRQQTRDLVGRCATMCLILSGRVMLRMWALVPRPFVCVVLVLRLLVHSVMDSADHCAGVSA